MIACWTWYDIFIPATAFICNREEGYGEANYPTTLLYMAVTRFCTHMNESSVFLVDLYKLLIRFVPHGRLRVCAHSNKVWHTLRMEQEGKVKRHNLEMWNLRL